MAQFWRRQFKFKPKRVDKYKSLLESNVAEGLSRFNEPFKYEQKTLSYLIPEKLHKYTPDFELHNGILVEVKGVFDAEDRQKLLYVREQHPDKDIRLVFSSLSKRITPTSKTTYEDWCIAHRFKYAKLFVPREWIEERREQVEKLCLCERGYDFHEGEQALAALGIPYCRYDEIPACRYIHLLIAKDIATLKELKQLMMEVSPRFFCVVSHTPKDSFTSYLQRIPAIVQAAEYSACQGAFYVWTNIPVRKVLFSKGATCRISLDSFTDTIASKLGLPTQGAANYACKEGRYWSEVGKMPLLEPSIYLSRKKVLSAKEMAKVMGIKTLQGQTVYMENELCKELSLAVPVPLLEMLLKGLYRHFACKL